GGTGRGQRDHTGGRIDRVPAIVVTRADGEGHVIAVHVTGLDLAQLDARCCVLVVADRVAGRRRVACAIGARRGEDRAGRIRARRCAALVRVFKHRCFVDVQLVERDGDGGRAAIAVAGHHGDRVAVARALVVICQRGGTGRGQGDHTRARIDRIPAVVVARADGEGHVI